MDWYRNPEIVDGKAHSLFTQNNAHYLRIMLEDAKQAFRSAREMFDAAMEKAKAVGYRPNGSFPSTEQAVVGADLAACEHAFYAAKWTLWCVERALTLKHH